MQINPTNSMNTQKSSGKPLLAFYDSSRNRPFTIGDLYIPGKTSWPEGVCYNFANGYHELFLRLDTPLKKEIDAVQNGEVEFRLYVEKDVILLVYRFGKELGWSDAPYNWHINPESMRTYPETLGDTEEVFFHIILVDSSTGILRAARTVRLGHEFSKDLHQAINQQIQLPFHKPTYDSNLRLIYAKFRSRDLAYRSKTKVVIP